VLPCPARLPHDLQVGQKLARWFGEGYNKWYVGKITEVNRRRTKQENVSVVWSLRKRGLRQPRPGATSSPARMTTVLTGCGWSWSPFPSYLTPRAPRLHPACLPRHDHHDTTLT